MALIKCKECGKKFSDQVVICPNCSAPTPPTELTWIEKINIEAAKAKKNEKEELERIYKLSEQERVIEIKKREKHHNAIKEDQNAMGILFVSFIIAIIAGFILYKFITPSEATSSPLSAQEIKENSAQELLFSQFSGFNGSHAALVTKVKNTMHNPDSFEHVDTIYYWTDETKKSAGDKITVRMTYRGTNAFGGVVTETVMAQVDTHGNVLEVLGQ